MISFDSVWSGFLLKRTDPARKARTAPRARTLGPRHPDASRVVVPEELAAALKRNERAKAAYESLPDSHHKEYVSWVLEAKKEATRAARVQRTVERLERGSRGA